MPEQTEAARVEAAIEDAQAAVADGDTPVVAAEWAIERHDVEHRLVDVLKAIPEVEIDA